MSEQQSTQEATAQTAMPTASDIIKAGEAKTESVEVPKEESKVTLEQALGEKKEEPTQDEDKAFLRKFNALAKKERELFELEQSLKAKQNSFSSLDEFKKLAKRDPQKYLEESGLTYDELTEFYLSGGTAKDPKVYEVEEKVAEIERKLKEKEEMIARKEQEAAIQSFKLDQKKHIVQSADKYELINATGSFDLVYDVSKQYYEKHNKVLTNDEAAQMVEEYLEKEVEKVLKANKIRNKFATAENKTETAKKTDEGKETIKTLSNNMASGVNPSTAKPLSRDESLERAAALLRWK
jgi:adenosine deaminase